MSQHTAPVHGPAGRILNPQPPAVLQEKPERWPTRRWDGALIKPLPQVLLERRMTVHFSGEPVSPEMVTAILSLAGQAPSAFNLQPWRFVVVQDKQNRDRLRPFIKVNSHVVSEAPVVVVALGMKEEWRATLEEVLEAAVNRGAERAEAMDRRRQQVLQLLANQPLDAWVHKQTMVAMTAAVLLAEAYGFDTALLDQVDCPALKRELLIPDEAEVVALLAIGHAHGGERPYPGRFGVERIAYRERFGRQWS